MMSKQQQQEIESRTLSILIADVTGYSSLEEYEQVTFFSDILPKINEKLSGNNVENKNSWGDGVFGTFSDPESAADAALAIRDLFHSQPWQQPSKPDLSDLKIRVALHMGTVYTGHNPVRDEEGIVGTDVNMTARIEPITAPNHVFVSQRFKTNLESESSSNTFDFDEFPDESLAKDWGNETIYHLRRQKEKKLEATDIDTKSERDVSQQSESSALDAFFETGDPSEQIRAVEILSNRGNTSDITVLSDRLVDKSVPGRVRTQIAGRLDEFTDSRVIDPLLDVIEENEQPSIVKNAVICLKNLSEKGVANTRVIQTMEQVALSEKEYPDEIRGAATLVMGEFEDQRSIDALSQILLDHEQTTAGHRQRAAKAISKQESQETVDTLIDALKDPDPNVKQAIIKGLGKIGNSKAIQPLCELLLNEQEGFNVRVAITDALKEIGDRSAINHLDGVLEINNPNVRGACIYMLGELNAERLISDIESIVEDGSNSTYERKMGIAAISKIGSPDSVDTLERLLEEDNEELKINVPRGLAGIETKRSREILKNIVNNGDNIPEMRNNAVLSLRKQARKSTLDTLINATGDQVFQVRKSAIEAISKLEQCREADQRLIEIVKKSETYSNQDRATAAWQLRDATDQYQAMKTLFEVLENESNEDIIQSAIDSLGVIANEEATEKVVDFVDKSYSRPTRRSALLSLAFIGDPAAVEQTKKVAYDDSNPKSIRGVALAALGRIDTRSASGILNNISADQSMDPEIRLRAREYMSKDASEIKKMLMNMQKDALNNVEADLSI